MIKWREPRGTTQDNGQQLTSPSGVPGRSSLVRVARVAGGLVGNRAGHRPRTPAGRIHRRAVARAGGAAGRLDPGHHPDRRRVPVDRHSGRTGPLWRRAAGAVATRPRVRSRSGRDGPGRLGRVDRVAGATARATGVRGGRAVARLLHRRRGAARRHAHRRPECRPGGCGLDRRPRGRLSVGGQAPGAGPRGLGLECRARDRRSPRRPGPPVGGHRGRAVHGTGGGRCQRGAAPGDGGGRAAVGSSRGHRPRLGRSAVGGGRAGAGPHRGGRARTAGGRPGRAAGPPDHRAGRSRRQRLGRQPQWPVPLSTRRRLRPLQPPGRAA